VSDGRHVRTHWGGASSQACAFGAETAAAATHGLFIIDISLVISSDFGLNDPKIDWRDDTAFLQGLPLAVRCPEAGGAI
jgi:hypothetical protein